MTVYLKVDETGVLTEVGPATAMRGPDGILHSWNVFECWTDEALAEIGLYKHEPLPVPEGHMTVGLPTYSLQGGSVIEQRAVVKLPEPEPAPEAPPAPPPLPPRDLGKRIYELLEEQGVDLSSDEARDAAKRMAHSDLKLEDMFSFGGIVMRKLSMERAGDWHQGHRHNYDHVTQLIRGSVIVEVGTNPPKKFTAPANIPIRAEEWHKITAAEDDVVYYCTYRVPEAPELAIGGPAIAAESEITPEEALERFKQLTSQCLTCEASCGLKDAAK